MQNWSWLRRNYGPVVFLDSGAGEKFRLIDVIPTRDKTLLVTVLDSHGSRLASQAVALYYDADPPLLELDSERLQSPWAPRAFWDYTGVDGSVNFPVDLHLASSYTVWVMSLHMPSDGLSGITMNGGGLALLFQVGRDPEEVHALENALWQEGDSQRVLGIAQSLMVRSILADGFLPDGPEFTIDWQGGAYVGQTACAMDGAQRVYYCGPDKVVQYLEKE